MEQLKDLRARIDEADDALLEVLAERMKVVEEILNRKEDDTLPLFDQEREQELLLRIADKARLRKLDPRLAQNVLRQLIGFARECQSRKVQERRNPKLSATRKVAFQGTRGAYSWMAARKHFSEKIEPVGFPGFAEAIQALENAQVDLALLPAENALAGSIYQVYDLIAHSRLHVVGEEILRIEHCLIGLPGTSPEDVQTVISHPVALEQCTKFAESQPTITFQSFIDSAEAVRKVKEDGNPSQAAVASREAARLYGLEVIRENISDHEENFTRFWVVARDPVQVDLRIPAKTSILLVTEHREGALVSCLAALAAQGINLTKIESRPRRGSPWQYQFYLDMDGNIAEERMLRALDDVRSKARLLRILGCYPRAERDGAERRPPISITQALESAEPAPPAASAPRAQPLISRKRRPERTTVLVGDVPVGDGDFVVMAGPCAVESRRQIMQCAALVRSLGARILRGGAYKPRTSPYSFQGLGAEGVELLVEAGRAHEMPVVSEVLAAEQVQAMAERVDLLQVGARNMQNFPLLKELGKVSKPILLKRGMSSTIKELLMAAEYILAEGNQQVILCERGIRTFETATRTTLDLGAVAVLKEQSHLPVIVDPSHAPGRADWVPPLARAARAVGADGILVEVHPHPQEALCDAEQALSPQQFEQLMRDLSAYQSAQ